MAKQISFSFLLLIFIAVIIIYLYYSEIITDFHFKSIMFAKAVAILNYVLFLIMFKISVNKTTSQFILINIGGMLLRILLVLSLIFVIFKFLKVDEYRFIFAFFIMYFLLLVFELFIVIKTISRKPYGNLKDVIQ